MSVPFAQKQTHPGSPGCGLLVGAPEPLERGATSWSQLLWPQERILSFSATLLGTTAPQFTRHWPCFPCRNQGVHFPTLGLKPHKDPHWKTTPFPLACIHCLYRSLRSFWTLSRMGSPGEFARNVEPDPLALMRNPELLLYKLLRWFWSRSGWHLDKKIGRDHTMKSNTQ